MSVGIRKIAGVESVDVSLNQGLARVRLKPGNTARLEQFRDVVERNGFTPKDAKIAVRGQIVSTGPRPQFKLPEANQVYELEPDPKAGLKTEDIQKQAGKTVLLEGAIPPPEPSKAKAPQLIRVTAIRAATD